MKKKILNSRWKILRSYYIGSFICIAKNIIHELFPKGITDKNLLSVSAKIFCTFFIEQNKTYIDPDIIVHACFVWNKKPRLFLILTSFKSGKKEHSFKCIISRSE